MIDLSAIASNLQPGPDGLWHPRSRSRFDYPDAGNAFCFQVEDHSFWFRHRNTCILDAIRRLPPRGAIFDIGGGNGFVARALVQAGYEAIVVEPGPTGARNAQARGLAPVVCAALDDAGFAPESLPAAGLFDVLEHMPDDRHVLAQLAGLLPRGGRVYLPCRRTSGCGRATTTSPVITGVTAPEAFGVWSRPQGSPSST